MALGQRVAGTPRVPIVADLTCEQRETLAKTPTGSDGRHLNVFLTLAHHPRLLKRFNVLAGAFQKGVLPVVDRELVILRVAGRCGAAYEYAEHSRIALQVGLTLGDIEHLGAGTVSPTWDERQRALVGFTDQLLAHDAVEDSVWEAVPFSEDHAAMLELLCLIGFYRMTAGLLNSARVELESHEDEAEIA